MEREKESRLLMSTKGNSKDVLTLGQENVGHPVLYKNYILFNSPITGIDNIFAFDLQTKTAIRLRQASMLRTTQPLPWTAKQFITMNRPVMDWML